MSAARRWIGAWVRCVAGCIALPRYWAGAGFVIGLFGLVYSIGILPGMDAPLSEVTWWVWLYFASTALALSCIPGFKPEQVTSDHLKVVDLVWVLASSVGAVLAIIQGYQFFAEHDRANFVKHMAESREMAGTLFDVVLARDCDAAAAQPAMRCDRVRRLRTLLGTRVPFDVADLDGACPSSSTFNPGRPPAGFSSERMAGCVQALYVANTSALDIVKDEQNVESWRRHVVMWSLAMIFFVSLRISKGVAEVVWKVGPRKKESEGAAGVSVMTAGQ